MEDFAHVDAASDQVVARRVNVIDGEDEGVRSRDSLAKNDRGVRVVRCDLHGTEVTVRNIDVNPPAEFVVERLGAIYVGNARGTRLRASCRPV